MEAEGHVVGRLGPGRLLHGTGLEGQQEGRVGVGVEDDAEEEAVVLGPGVGFGPGAG